MIHKNHQGVALKYDKTMKYFRWIFRPIIDNNSDPDKIMFMSYLCCIFDNMFTSFEDAYNYFKYDILYSNKFINCSVDTINIYCIPIEIWSIIFHYLNDHFSRLISFCSSYLYKAYKYSPKKNFTSISTIQDNINQYFESADDIHIDSLLESIPIVYVDNINENNNEYLLFPRKLYENIGRIRPYFDLLEGIIFTASELFEISGFILEIGGIPIKFINDMTDKIIPHADNLYKINIFNKPFFVRGIVYHEIIIKDLDGQTSKYTLLSSTLGIKLYHNYFRNDKSICYKLPGYKIKFLILDGMFGAEKSIDYKNITVNFSDVYEIIKPII